MLHFTSLAPNKGYRMYFQKLSEDNDTRRQQLLNSSQGESFSKVGQLQGQDNKVNNYSTMWKV